MSTDDHYEAWLSAASHRAEYLSLNGGLCMVSPGLAARFDVELADGRVLRGCGIHGYGGSLRGPTALERARKLAAHPAYADRFPLVRFYLVEHPYGNFSLEVPREQVVSIKWTDGGEEEADEMSNM